MSTETISPATVAQGKTFVWHEHYSSDNDKAIEFYTKALGYGTQDFPMEGMGTYRMLTNGDQAVCGIVNTKQIPNGENIPPHWATFIGVDNVDARLEKCKSLGATVVVPTMDVPTVGRMVLIQDPLGAHIWLFQPAQQ